jgi:nanoRNase/pAp phosphatase (c-di-AMP/oligoRNAs hydrolase)
MNRTKSSQQLGKLGDLIAVISRSKKILILPHNNPDPDALASSAALRFLIKQKLRKDCSIGCGGTIGRSENRALVSVLALPLTPVEQLFPAFDGSVILVDTQPGRANNALPSEIIPAAVIDHHPDWGENKDVPFVDLRESYGATSTLLTEYLQHAELHLDARVATGLFYGISSETQHLGRETMPADIVASQFLYPYVDKRLLGAIESPRLRRGYFGIIAQAVHTALLYDDVVIATLESPLYPDAVAEIADFLLRLETANWAACLAPYEDFLYVSLRTEDPDATAGQLLASILPPGMAGGHGMVAGGRMKISPRGWRKAANNIAGKFLKSLGKERVRPQPLVSPRRTVKPCGRYV